MGPDSCKASKYTAIAYAILVLAIVSQLECVKASPLPKTVVPPLEGPSNYKQWANLVKNSLIVLSIWYAVNSNKPEEYEKITDKLATDTKKEAYHWGTTVKNHANISKWTEDDTKATAYISLFAGPIAEQHINHKKTARENWKILKDRYSTHSTMATFQSLQALQQFKFDPNSSFAMQIKNLELAHIELMDCGKTITDNDMALTMLMGLLDSWSNVVSAFLATQANLFEVSPDAV
jgi:hypothetical protein